MNVRITMANERGSASYDWLKAGYSFSFAEYFDPMRERFGVLRVLNEDVISGGGGFGMHPHNNLEIITMVLSGALEHKDSSGHSTVIHADEIQYMSAGTGVEHTEKNYHENLPVHLLQIWIFPKTRNTQPRYDQLTLKKEKQRNTIHTVVSPDGGDEVIQINQDAWLSLLDSDREKKYTYSNRLTGNGIYIFVIGGKIEFAGNTLGSCDAAAITGTDQIEFTALEETSLLIIEVPED